jgi:hypothetical protein
MEAGWLKQSLREAAEGTKRIPEWARQMLDAHEAYYGPQSSRLNREQAARTQQPRESDASESGPSA